MDILADLGLFGAVFALFTWVVKRLIVNQEKYIKRRDEQLIDLIKDEREMLSNHMSQDVEVARTIANILGRIEGKLNNKWG